MGRGFYCAVAMACILATSPAAADDYRHLVIGGHELKWGAPILGVGAVVTYALAEFPERFPNARNCPEIVPLPSVLKRNGIELPFFKRELQAAFSAWSEIANVDFVESNAASANIIIGAQARAKGRAFTNVEFDDNAPDGEIARLNRAVICLNPSTPWKVGFDGNLQVYDLRRTLVHEIGHSIGLNHPFVAGQIMSFRYSEDQTVPQPGDIAGVVSLYGSRQQEFSSHVATRPTQPHPFARAYPAGLGLSD